MGGLLACWLLVGATPALAATASHAATGGPALAAPSSLADDAEPVDEAVEGTNEDREIVVGLIAIVLLVVTIGAHALYRDRT